MQVTSRHWFVRKRVDASVWKSSIQTAIDSLLLLFRKSTPDRKYKSNIDLLLWLSTQVYFCHPNLDIIKVQVTQQGGTNLLLPLSGRVGTQLLFNRVEYEASNPLPSLFSPCWKVFFVSFMCLSFNDEVKLSSVLKCDVLNFGINHHNIWRGARKRTEITQERVNSSNRKRSWHTFLLAKWKIDSRRYKKTRRERGRKETERANSTCLP